MSKEKILNAIHIKWLSKAKTAVINGEEMTVLPYGYLTQACSDVIDQTREETIRKVEELLSRYFDMRTSAIKRILNKLKK